MHRFTHLARTFDPRLRTHRAITVIGIASAALALAAGGDLIDGGRAGFAAAIAWAIGRELHPDSQMAGLTAGVIGGVFEALVGGATFGALWLLLVILRIITRSTGASPLPTDLALNLGFVLLVSDSVVGFMSSLGIAVVLFISPSLPKPGPRSHRWWAAAFVVVALIGAAFATIGESAPTPGASWLLLSISLLLSVGLFAPEQVKSLGDIDKEPLDDARVRLGRIELTALLIVITITTVGGGIAAIAPAFAAVAASGAFRLKELVSS